MDDANSTHEHGENTVKVNDPAEPHQEKVNISCLELLQKTW